MKGSCMCGEVSFQVTQHISAIYQCHCKLCQKQSGSTSNTATIIQQRYFNWIAGETSITHWQKDTGFTSDFCKVCGCPVPNRLRDSEYFWIPMGLVNEIDNFTDVEPPQIKTHICCNDKAMWDNINDSAKQIPNLPDDVFEFFNSFNSVNCSISR